MSTTPWFGIGEPAKVLVIGLAMLAPIAISTASGVRSAPHSQINAASALAFAFEALLRLIERVLLPWARHR